MQGLSNKKTELLHQIHSNQSSIIAIQETKLSHDYLLKIPHFNVYSKDGHYNQGWHGGVALYIHSDIPIVQLKFLQTYNRFHTLSGNVRNCEDHE